MSVASAHSRSHPFAPARRVAVVATAVFLVVAGCGGDDDDADARSDDTSAASTTTAAPGTTSGDEQGSTGATDACGLVTPDDIEAALDVTVGDGISTDDGSVSTCTFESDDGASVGVTRYDPVGDLIANSVAADSNLNELPGVGDEAVERIDRGRLLIARGRDRCRVLRESGADARRPRPAGAHRRRAGVAPISANGRR